MWLWKAWFNPNSFYSYCVVVPFISIIIAYTNIKAKKPLSAMLFPLVFLVFMFPLPDNITTPISHQLKYLSALIATNVLNLFQIPSVANGNVIVMTHGMVVVNDACSGIRAIISLFAMGSVFAYYMKTRLNRKLFIMALIIPLAILTNATRIVLLAVITQFWGAQYITGLVHNGAGLMIYGLSFLVLWLISRELTYF